MPKPVSPVQAAFADYWETLEDPHRDKRIYDLVEGAFFAGALWAAEQTHPDEIRARVEQMRLALEERCAEKAALIRWFEEIDAQPADFLEYIGPTHREDYDFIANEAKTVGEVIEYLLAKGDTIEWLEEVFGLMEKDAEGEGNDA